MLVSCEGSKPIRAYFNFAFAIKERGQLNCCHVFLMKVKAVGLLQVPRQYGLGTGGVDVLPPGARAFYTSKDKLRWVDEN